MVEPCKLLERRGAVGGDCLRFAAGCLPKMRALLISRANRVAARFLLQTVESLRRLKATSKVGRCFVTIGGNGMQQT